LGGILSPARKENITLFRFLHLGKVKFCQAPAGLAIVICKKNGSRENLSINQEGEKHLQNPIDI